MPDPAGILNLAKDFSYRILSRAGDAMADGWVVPSAFDGMGLIPMNDGNLAFIRNHELKSNDSRLTHFGKQAPRHMPSEICYDPGKQGVVPCGGTTTLIYDPKAQKVVDQRLSITGTILNCAGGITPWGTWISCEEAFIPSGGPLKKHGYCFEVSPTHDGNPQPIKDMGLFRHEAVCFHPSGGVAYLTEDRIEGLFYRFLMHDPTDLHAGGKLQTAVITHAPNQRTANHRHSDYKAGQKYQVSWIDIDDPDPEEDVIRSRGANRGAAIFCRGEDIVFDGHSYLFTCTEGGPKRLGQIWRYTPSKNEGTNEEKNDPATIELFVESHHVKSMSMCDNLCISPFGDVIVCEDGKEKTQRILAVRPDGTIYVVADHIANRSELAGCCWSPDGSTLFINVYHPGMTIAITGPWPSA